MEQPKHSGSKPAAPIVEYAPAPAEPMPAVTAPFKRALRKTATRGIDNNTGKEKDKRVRTLADEEARRIVRAEMARRDFSYKQLVVALERLGHKKVTEGNLISRISRGTFTFAFAIDVLRAMGATVIDVSPVNIVRGSGKPIEQERGR